MENTEIHPCRVCGNVPTVSEFVTDKECRGTFCHDFFDLLDDDIALEMRQSARLSELETITREQLSTIEAEDLPGKRRQPITL